MGDLVTCKECGTRYDTSQGFCPRCGSTARGPATPAAVAVAQRRDPGRRRVQASGAVLLAVGALLAVVFAAMLALSGTLTQGFLDDMQRDPSRVAVPGGSIVVLVTDAGAPAPGVPVNVTTLDGVAVTNGTTDEGGRFEARLGGTAFANVTVARDGDDLVRRVVAIDGSAVTLRFDLGAASAAASWAGFEKLQAVMRVVLAVFLAVALLLAAAGVCALALRAWSVALAGAAIGMVPALVLTVASLSLGAFLMLVVVGVPLVLIARGRRYFLRAA